MPSSPQNLEVKLEDNPFNLIYTSVQERNKIQLEQALLKASINIRYRNHTPASGLAFENTAQSKEALDYILANNPSDRLTILKEMASGYAQRGAVAEANALLAQVKNPADQQVVLSSMAYGYALVANVTEANLVLEKLENQNQVLPILKYMVWGYALGGHQELVNLHLSQAKPTQRLALLQFAVNDYAEGGFVDEMQELQFIASGHACAGRVHEVQAVLKMAKEAQRSELWKHIAWGYALGGHLIESQAILKMKKKNIKKQDTLPFLISGFARAGNIEAVNALLLEITKDSEEEQFLKKSIMHEYALGGHVRAANGMLQKENNPEKRLVLLKIMMEGYIKGGYVSQATALVAMGGNPYNREMLIGALDERLKKHGQVVKVAMQFNTKKNALLNAAARGNLKAAQIYIEENKYNSAALNVYTANGYNALILAVDRGDVDMVKLLIGSGINVNIINDYGNCALTLAASNGNLAIVEALLASQDINLNAVDNFNNSAFILAARHGHLPIVQTLLAKGVNKGIRDRENHTAEMSARCQGHTEISQLLTDISKNEFLEAAREGDLQTLTRCLEEYKYSQFKLCNVVNAEGESALIMAINREDLAMVKVLIAFGMNVNIPNKNGDTALTLAASMGNLPMVNALLRAPGIHIDAVNQQKNSALILAAMKGHKSVVQTLLDWADLRLMNSNHEDAEQAALERKQVKIANLIKKHIKFNRFDNFTRLPNSIQSEIAKILPNKELSRSFTSNHQKALFKPIFDERNFLRHVVCSEYDAVRAIFKKNPTLYFESGRINDCSGRTFLNISAFEYALWSLDTNMVATMLAYLPRDERRKAILEELSAQYQRVKTSGVTYVNQRKMAVTEQHFDFSFLVGELGKPYLPGDSNDPIYLKRRLSSLREAQRLVPMHVVHEYCSRRSFDPLPDFSQKPELPASKQILNATTGEFEQWYQKNSQLGEADGFAIYKANLGHAEGRYSPDPKLQVLDHTAMLSLSITRTKEFNALEDQLKLMLSECEQMTQTQIHMESEESKRSSLM